MSKLLFILLLVVVGVIAWRLSARNSRQKAAPETPPPQRIVLCAECDIHVPESEAIAFAGRHFCGEEHRLAFVRRHPEAS